MSPQTIHASAVVIGEAGVLIRGASGAGKSSLAAALIREGERRGLFSRLVGDDRIHLDVSGDRLTARPHRRIAGLLETRGVGIAPVPSEPVAILRLVVDLGEAPGRMPDLADRSVALEGVILPRLRLPAAQAVHEQACRVVEQLARNEP